MEVKICGMRDAENIKQVQELCLPDYLGCIIYPQSPRYVDPESLEDISKVVHKRVKKVLVTVDADLVDIMDWADRLQTQIVQLHGSESPETCAQLKDAGYQVWKAIGILHLSDLNKTSLFENKIHRFLFDTKSTLKGGTGVAFDWTILNSYVGSTPYMLSGGIGPGMEDAVNEWINSDHRCVGIDINSRFEVQPGIKDPVILNIFIKKIRER